MNARRWYDFGRFRLDSQRRELLADGIPVAIGSRALDVLTVLIEACGELVTKDELSRRAWSGTIVEENTLQFQISTLRKALGPDRNFIKTISGRGYSFVAEITTVATPEEVTNAASAAPRRDLPRPNNLPVLISGLVGRETQLSDVVALVATHRLVTLVGAGGIGKTRLGLEVARCLVPQFTDGAWLVGLGPLSGPELVLPTIATTFGLAEAGPTTPERIAEALAPKHLLLVLDNCEHVIDASARIAEVFLQTGASLRVVATSREPLRVDGECVYRVPPLDVPTEDSPDGDDPLRYGAVRLFIERARAAEAGFSPEGQAAAAIGSVCRRLDGIPLAIELAASRAAALGVGEVATHLDARFDLLTDGRRTALPQHRTLRATLDWSYELLPEPERAVLRRLAIFPSGFTLKAASAVAAGAEIRISALVDYVANLVAKSLVTGEFGSESVRYRLIETTRAYALERLTESGELDIAARRHAEYYQDLFERAEAEWEAQPTAEWLADYGRQVDNVRAALDWAFSPGGDMSIGVVLTAAAVPLWTHLSLVEECRGRVEQALAALAAGATRDARREMTFHVALAASLIYSRGVTGAEIGAAWTRALEIAESIDDADYRLRSLWGLWFFHTASGRHLVALALAQRFRTLAASRSDPNDRPVGEQMIGVSQQFLGDQSSARRHIERALTHYLTSDHGSAVTRFVFDQRVTTRVFLARILWLQGFPDQAIRAAESGIEDAQRTNHAASLCYALALAACPIALLVGDLAAAERYVGMLLDHSTRHALAHLRAIVRMYQGELVIKQGDAVTGSRLLSVGFDELDEAKPVSGFVAFLRAEALGHAGQVSEGLAAVDELIARSEHTEERWLIAGLLRIRGELLLLEGAPEAAAAAEDHYHQGLDWARRQGALSLELRCATSLARLWHGQARRKEAHELLAAVYERFTEGFATADLRAAKAQLGKLG